MSTHALLLSIQSKYAEKIFNGKKRVELRRVRPRLEKGDYVFVYVPSPQKALVGTFEVEKVIEGIPQYLWEDVKKDAGMTLEEFQNYYFERSLGFGIFLSKTWSFSRQVNLDSLKQVWPEFQPPQGYRYLTPSEANLIWSQANGGKVGAM